MNPARPQAQGWRLRWLLAAPHRLAFLAAVAMLALSSAWWAVVVWWRGQGGGLAWAVPPSVAHGLLLAHGFFPLFFAGFLFTAGPRWLARPPVAPRALLAPVATWVAAWGVFAIGAVFSAGVSAAAVAAAGLALAALTRRFVAMLRASAVGDTRHAQLIALACCAGVGLLGWAALGLALQDLRLVRAVLQGSLWGCLALVFVSAVHRMVPFFTAAAFPALDAWRPLWLLWVLAAALALQAVLATAEGLWGPLPMGLRWAQAAFEAAMALLLGGLAWRWGLVQSLRMRLLAMLHLGFLWLALAFALGAASHALMALTGDALSLGLAPQHALAMGFLGSMMLAMVTRVSCGHGGRAVVADDFAWRVFWLLQSATVARVGAALWPATASALLIVAALTWAGAALAWALRLGHWYGTPRPDGRPG